jgi:hypothetical protein
MSKLESQPDHEFENTILKVENAALQLELKESIAAQKAATEQIGKLAPVAATAAKLASENKILRDTAAANEVAVTNAAQAVTQWGLWVDKHKTLSDQYAILNKENGDKSRSVTRWSDEAEKQEKLVAERDREIRSLEQTERAQETKIRQLNYSFFGTAAMVVLVVVCGLVAQEQLIRVPEEISTEARADWEKHSAEYRQAYANALERRLEKETVRIRAEEQSAAFYKGDERRWGFWDVLYGWGFLGVGVVVGFVLTLWGGLMMWRM